MSDPVIDFPVSVVLPAGGSGERMGIGQPKQYCVVLNRPLIVFTLNAFNRIPWIQHIVITVSAEYKDFVKSLVQKYGFTKVIVAEGATTRHRSIYYGIKALETVCDTTDVVVIHDAVRIFIEEQLFKQIVMAAKSNYAAGVTRPLVSTVIAVDSNGCLEESLDRTKYRASEMPQAFIYGVIKSAYEKATDYDFDYGTECLLLAHKYMNTQAKIVEGPSSLWKVTYMKDLHAAEAMLKESLVKVRLIGCDKRTEQHLKDALTEQRLKVCGQMMDIVGDIKDSSVDSYVYMYNSFDPEKIKFNSEQCTSVKSDSTLCCPLIDRVIVHLVSVREFDGNSFMEFLKLLQILTATVIEQQTLFYGVLCKENENMDKVSKMVASILWNRDMVMNGQVFVVHSDL